MDTGENTDDMSGNTCLLEYKVDPEESITHAVVEAVATASDTEMEEMPPLYYSVETEALDRLLLPRINGTPRTNVTVQFTYCGTDVTVNEKTIVVHFPEE